MGNEQMETGAVEAVRIVSRRMVQPPPEEEVVDIQLKPCDLRLITADYIQKGILLPKPPAGGECLVDTLAISFARALAGRFYSLAGRLVVKHHTDETISVVLRCTGESAEFVHGSTPWRPASPSRTLPPPSTGLRWYGTSIRSTMCSARTPPSSRYRCRRCRSLSSTTASSSVCP
ncbi:hypothetical protein ACQ4PT_050164 [Festuca glaucescens]